MLTHAPSKITPSWNRSMERIMTTGSTLYLILCLVMFAAFSLVLAYESLRQPKLRQEPAAEPSPLQDSDHPVAA
jgi:hypothetical protein